MKQDLGINTISPDISENTSLPKVEEQMNVEGVI